MKMKNLLTVVVILTIQTLTQSNADSTVEFTIDAYKQLKKGSDGNLVVSPLSAQIVTALAYTGASGKTRDELGEALYFSDKQEAQRTFRQLLSNLQESDKYTLSFANKAYVKHCYSFTQSFKAAAVDDFKTAVGNIDFASSFAADEINAFVEEHTHGQIKHLVSKSDFSKKAEFALVNTLFFNATWKKSFASNATTRQPFYVRPYLEKTTDVMTDVRVARYASVKELKAQVLELPFDSSSLLPEPDATMTFVLPYDKNGLNNLEEKLDLLLLSDPNLEDIGVLIELPKFKIENSINFEEVLKQLGVKKAFTRHAEFKDIVRNESLHIAKIKQKSFLEVTELGTIASAATIVVGETSFPAYQRFIANHPFLYFIRVKGAILVIGRVTDP